MNDTMPNQLPPLQGAFHIDTNNAGMDALANATAEGIEVSINSSGESIEWGTVMDAAIWEILMTQVRAQLCASTSDQYFSRAWELQMLGRSEVVSRGRRITNAVDFMAVGQPVLERSTGCQPHVSASFVPISPMRSSRHAKPVKSFGYHNIHSAGQLYPPPVDRRLSPPTSDVVMKMKPPGLPSPLPLSTTALSMSGYSSSQFHAEGGTSMLPLDNDRQTQFGIHEECYDGPNRAFTDHTMPGSLVVGTTDDGNQRGTFATGQPTRKVITTGPIRVSKKWSEIQGTKSQKQTHGKAKKKTSFKSRKRPNGKTKRSASAGIACFPSRLDVQAQVKSVKNISSKLRKLPKGKTEKAVAGIVPSGLDVLGGRGGKTNNHAGNLLFRDEARKLRGIYQDTSSTKSDKYSQSEELVKTVKDYGGRFLAKGDDGMWYEMDDGRVRKKASQALRENKWD